MEQDTYSYDPQPASYLYEVPKPPMLIEGILPRAAVVGLSGYPGTGKTWLALEMSRALATGTPFLDAFPVKQASVLFVGSDSSEYDYATCWRRLTLKQYEALGGRDADTNRYGEEVGDFNVLSDRVRFLIQSDFSFDEADKVHALVKAMNYEWGRSYIEPEHEAEDDDGLPFHVPEQEYQPHGVGVVFIDTLGSVTDQDLIDNTKMIGVYRNIRLLAESTGATIVLLHHNPKGGSSWLGAISQVGKLDSWMNLRTTVGKKRLPDGTINVEFKKFRGIKPEPFYYHMAVNHADVASLNKVADPFKVVAPSVVPATKVDPDRALVLDLLKGGERRLKDFVEAKQMGLNPAANEDSARKTLEKKLAKLVEDEEVLVEKAPGKPSIWRLPSSNSGRGRAA